MVAKRKRRKANNRRYSRRVRRTAYNRRGRKAAYRRVRRNRQMDRVGKVHTKIGHDGGIVTIKYHATNVVTFNDKEIVLRTGGWKTKTTKARMDQASNQFGLGYSIQ